MKSFLQEFWLFGIKQAYACLFGGLFLLLILITQHVDFLPMFTRYDELFFLAILIQLLMIVFKLESPRELKAIFLFHLIGTAMEVFKTSEGVGSWSYPGESIFTIGNVPLFSGFMYGAVGSYMARAWKIFNFKFKNYPPFWVTALISILIYLNFFTHHYFVDVRYLLFVLVIFFYRKTVIFFTIKNIQRKMPLLLGFFLVSIFIWFAENISTFSEIWLYPEQVSGWKIVGIEKLGSWFLLMIISFVMVTSLYFKKENKS